jgi:hypothetical protein
MDSSPCDRFSNNHSRNSLTGSISSASSNSSNHGGSNEMQLIEDETLANERSSLTHQQSNGNKKSKTGKSKVETNKNIAKSTSNAITGSKRKMANLDDSKFAAKRSNVEQALTAPTTATNNTGPQEFLDAYQNTQNRLFNNNLMLSSPSQTPNSSFNFSSSSSTSSQSSTSSHSSSSLLLTPTTSNSIFSNQYNFAFNNMIQENNSNNNNTQEITARLLFMSIKWCKSLPSFAALPLRDQVYIKYFLFSIKKKLKK